MPDQSPGADNQAFIERLRVDPKFLTSLLLASDIGVEIQKAGFNLDLPFFHYVESFVSKSRTYITDQIHVLEVKANQTEAKLTSRPGVKPHANSGNSAAGNW